MREYRPFNADKFVMAWQTCDTIEEVAKKLHMDVRTVRNYGYSFKRRGIPLKEHRDMRGRWTNRIPELKKLAETLLVED